MAEPVYRWQPVTDVYQQQATEVADIQAEQEQKRQEINEEPAKRIWAEKKAPLGITVFMWYYFARAGVSALLLLFVASFPHSGPSTLVLDTIGNFLHLPGSQSSVEARKQAIAQMAQKYDVPENAIVDEGSVVNTDTMHNMVMVYLLVNLAAATWVGFLWWNGSWKVRWVAMFYSGALVGKLAINYIAGAASGVGSQIPAAAVPVVMISVVLNTFLFLYLAFGPGVAQWFERQS
jgi:hypothetical protein